MRVNAAIEKCTFDVSLHIISETLLPCEILIGTDVLFRANVELRMKGKNIKITEIVEPFFELLAVNVLNQIDEINAADVTYIEVTVSLPRSPSDRAASVGPRADFVPNSFCQAP